MLVSSRALALALVSSIAPTTASALVVFPPDALVLEGDAAPGGGSFAAFGAAAQNEIDDVAFRADLTGSLAETGIFLVDGTDGTVSAVALQGVTAPDTGGLQSYDDFGTPDLDPDGERVAFRATLFPSLGEGIFQDAGGVQSAIALTGEPAPGTAAPFESFHDPRVGRDGVGSPNDAVAFSAILADTGSGPGSGVFVYSGGALGAVALSGDPAPGVTGGTFVAFGRVDVAAPDELAFVGIADAGGGFEVGIFRHSAGTTSLVALDGEPAPGGGPAYSFGSVAVDTDLSLRPGGLVTFTDATRVFSHHENTGTTLHAEVGEAAPDTGGSFSDFVGRPSFGAGELRVFLATVSGGSAPEALFAKRAGFDEGALAAVGDAAPDTGGGSFAGFPFAPSTRTFADDPGRVSFAADVAGGSATSGVFRLPEPGMGAGLLAGGALLGMLHASRNRRRR